MARHTFFQGKELQLTGTPISIGDALPSVTLTGSDMQDLSTDQFKGKVLVVAAVPSFDTPVCAIETKRFNQEIDKVSSDAVVLAVSMDLPFAQKRFCGAEGIERVITASDYKYRSFGAAFGTFISDWGLHSRAIFVFDRAGKAVHVEYVTEVPSEPNYDLALEAVKAASK